MGSLLLKRLGPVFEEFPHKLDEGKLQPRVRIKCTEAGCPITDDIPTKSEKPPEYFLQHFQRKQWVINSSMRKATCPGCRMANRKKPALTLVHSVETPDADCQNHSLSSSSENAMRELPTLATPHAALTASVAEMSQPATFDRPLKRSEKMLLAETYLEENFVKVGDGVGYYRPHASDAHGAAESQMSVDDFVAVREHDFGKILDFGQMDANISASEKLIEDSVTKIDEMLSSLQRKILALDGLPAHASEFLRGQKIRIDQEKTSMRSRFERCIEEFETKCDSLYEEMDRRVNENWDMERTRAQSELIPQVEDLVTERGELENLGSQLAIVKARLPRELFQA